MHKMKQNRETVAAAMSATKRQMSDFFHHGIPSLFYILHVHTACAPIFLLASFFINAFVIITFYSISTRLIPLVRCGPQYIYTALSHYSFSILSLGISLT